MIIYVISHERYDLGVINNKTEESVHMETAGVLTNQTDEKEIKAKKRRKKWAQIKTNRALYLMLFPGILYFIVFKYIPMGGLVIAFQDYQPFLGILGSPFVGMKHFIRLFTDIGVRVLGKKNSLYAGLFLSILATMSYFI